ncbi:hypothetical protein FQR65_LT15934 [Abscondita terminalis]|nr:hypothetical protein FQR65_LT15934 [Abscondita terminalis]
MYIVAELGQEVAIEANEHACYCNPNSRMFKIVRTLERGKPTLSVVPNGWEQMGMLYWPRRKPEKLVKQADSLPTTGWLELKCQVKRQNLPTYQHAEIELRKMLANDDTDGITDFEEVPVPTKKTKVLPPKRNATYRTPQANFNSLVEHVVNNTHSETASSVLPPIIQPESSSSSLMLPFQDFIMNSSNGDGSHLQEVNPIQSFVILNNSENMNNYSNVDFNEGQVGDTIEVNKTSSSTQDDKFNTLLSNQTTIIENQIRIIQQLAKHESLFDELIKNSMSNSDGLATSKTSKKAVLTIPVEPIDSVEKLELLESKLKDEKECQFILNGMSIICGRTRRGCGIDHCYNLVDKFFTREFMTKCSWAGGTRDKINKEKIAFKSYKRVINLFFRLVHLADDDFSLEECHAFLKNVIRNSTRRNQSVFVRTSRSKKRPKTLEYKTKKSTEMEETITNAPHHTERLPAKENNAEPQEEVLEDQYPIHINGTDDSSEDE